MKVVLSDLEASLVAMAIRQREMAQEAANVAFNHAVLPLLRARRAKPDPVPEFLMIDGKPGLEYEPQEIVPALKRKR